MMTNMTEKRECRWDIVFAAAAWAAMSAGLLWLHYKVYGGRLLGDMSRLLWLMVLTPPVLALCLWLRRKLGAQNAVLTGRTATLLLCIAAAVCAVLLVSMPYQMMLWMWMFLSLYALALHLPGLRRWENSPAALGGLFLLALAVAGVFLLAARPATLRQAETSVTALGYQQVEYLPAAEMLPDAAPADGREGDLGYYWFVAEKDGVQEMVAVSVTTGAALPRAMELKTKENT